MRAPLTPYIYPFGMLIESRKHLAFGGDYAFGFNGKMVDKEVKGEGNSLDFGARIYDSRLGKWLAVDPLFKLQPDQSPYKAFNNNPILFVDPEGGTEYESTIFVDTKTGKQVGKTVTKVVSDDVVKAKSEDKLDVFGGTYTEHTYTDKVTQRTVYLKDGKVVDVQTDSKAGAVRLVSSFVSNVEVASVLVKSEELLTGEGDMQEGGYYFTTEGRTGSPTKTRALNYAETKDVDAIEGIGVLKPGFDLMKKGPSILKDIGELGKTKPQTINDEKKLANKKSELKKDTITRISDVKGDTAKGADNMREGERYHRAYQ